jgi:hypothetical protein
LARVVARGRQHSHTTARSSRRHAVETTIASTDPPRSSDADAIAEASAFSIFFHRAERQF